MKGSVSESIDAALKDEKNLQTWVSAPAGLGISQAIASSSAQLFGHDSIVLISAASRLSLMQWHHQLIASGAQSRTFATASEALVAIDNSAALATGHLLVTHAALSRIATALESRNEGISLFVIEDPPTPFPEASDASGNQSHLESVMRRVARTAQRTMVVSRDLRSNPWPSFNHVLSWDLEALQRKTGNIPEVFVYKSEGIHEDLAHQAKSFLEEVGEVVDPAPSLLMLQSQLLRVSARARDREAALRLSDAIDDAPLEPRIPLLTQLVSNARQEGRPILVRALRISDMVYVSNALEKLGHKTRIVSSSSEPWTQGDLLRQITDDVVIIGGKRLESGFSLLPARTAVFFWTVPRSSQGFVDAIAAGSRATDVQLHFLGSDLLEASQIQSALVAAADGAAAFGTVVEMDGTVARGDTDTRR